MADESRKVADAAPGFVRPKEGSDTTDRLEGYIAFSEGTMKVGDLLDRVQNFRGQDDTNGDGNPQNFTDEDKSWLKSTIDKLISFLIGGTDNNQQNTRLLMRPNTDVSGEDKNWIKSLIDKLLDFFLKLFGKKEENPVAGNELLTALDSKPASQTRPVARTTDSDEDKNWIKQLINRLLGFLLAMTGKGKSVNTGSTLQRPVSAEDTTPVFLKGDNQNTNSQFTEEDKNWIKGIIMKLMNFLFGSKPPQSQQPTTPTLKEPTITISVSATMTNTNPVT